jgi:hypothetical protein
MYKMDIGYNSTSYIPYLYILDSLTCWLTIKDRWYDKGNITDVSDIQASASDILFTDKYNSAEMYNKMTYEY